MPKALISRSKDVRISTSRAVPEKMVISIATYLDLVMIETRDI